MQNEQCAAICSAPRTDARCLERAVNIDGFYK